MGPWTGDRSAAPRSGPRTNAGSAGIGPGSQRRRWSQRKERKRLEIVGTGTRPHLEAAVVAAEAGATSAVVAAAVVAAVVAAVIVLAHLLHELVLPLLVLARERIRLTLLLTALLERALAVDERHDGVPVGFGGEIALSGERGRC